MNGKIEHSTWITTDHCCSLQRHHDFYLPVIYRVCPMCVRYTTIHWQQSSNRCDSFRKQSWFLARPFSESTPRPTIRTCWSLQLTPLPNLHSKQSMERKEKQWIDEYTRHRGHGRVGTRRTIKDDFDLVSSQYKPALEWWNFRMRWTKVVKSPSECHPVASSPIWYEDFRVSLRWLVLILVLQKPLCKGGTCARDICQFNQLVKGKVKCFNYSNGNAYLNVGKMNFSYSFWVASATNDRAGCKTAAKTSPNRISCCRHGQMCCHHSFYEWLEWKSAHNWTNAVTNIRTRQTRSERK